MVEGCC